MSTYLLLRNNKESGPFTVDEIKRMSLKAYDLVWVEGKSAAWRYPGEIAEFTGFAPQVPEQPYDRFYKKPVPTSNTAEIKTKITESTDGRRPDTNRDSVYINMPASDKKSNGLIPGFPIQQPIELNWDEPMRFSENMTNPPSNPQKTSGRGLLIASVILLFGAGMCTGFFISNRRNIYSTDVNTPHQHGVPVMSKDFPQSAPEQSVLLSASDSGKALAGRTPAASPLQASRTVVKSRKKTGDVSTVNKDSLYAATAALPVSHAADSSRIKLDAENKKAELAAKIKMHPEEYLPVTAGKFKTGVLGGISEFPVTLTNRSTVVMDLVVVRIDYILHNKKIFKTENVSFQNLAPGSTVTGEASKSSRGVNISFRLTTANAQQIGLAYSNP